MKCPVCDREGIPKCPFFKRCKYRMRGIASTNVCWKRPSYCDVYNRKTLLEKEKSWNPSQREKK